MGLVVYAIYATMKGDSMIPIHIYDLNGYGLSYKNGFYGGAAGNKEGIIINGESWMVKYPKNLSEMTGKGMASYSTSPLSEFIGSHIYEILGYDVHKTILGIRHKKLVIACKDFAVDGLLLEIRTIKNYASQDFAELLDTSPVSSTETHVVDLDELLLHIRKNPLLSNISGIEEHFFEQSLVDIFIGNNDRNSGNWGILRTMEEEDKIAPIFDNGGCFLAKAGEDKVLNLLGSHELKNNAVNTLTAYGTKDRQYSAIRFLDRTKDEPIMKEALQKVVPLLEAHMNDIFQFIESIPEEFEYNEHAYSVCSANRKKLYLKHMEIRYNELLRPAYEKSLTVE